MGPDARDEAYRDTHHEGDDGRGNHEAERDGKPLLNLLGHGLTDRERRAEVPVQRGVEPVPVLDEERIVEMELSRDVLDLGLSGADGTCQRDRRVAGTSAKRKKAANETVSSTVTRASSRRGTYLPTPPPRG